jgi:glyoxylase I family protein
MITALAHACYQVSDLAAADQLFVKTLGLKRHFDFTRKGEVIGFYLEVAPGSYLEFFRCDQSVKGEGPLRHICLGTPDLDAVIARCRAAGQAIGDKKMGCDGSWQAWIKGPDGIDIEFHQYTPASSQVTGRNCEVDW